MKNITYFLLISISFISCVSSSEYEKLLSEKESLESDLTTSHQETQKLQEELDWLNNGAPNMLTKIKTFIELKDYNSAIKTSKELIKISPNSIEASKAKNIQKFAEEENLWSQALSINNLDYTQMYISKYPKGTYISKAQDRLKELLIIKDKNDFNSAKETNSVYSLNSYLSNHPDGRYTRDARYLLELAEQQVVENAFNRAKSSNTSYSWKKFIQDYPDTYNRSEIEDLIIALEVDELFNDENTGKLPISNYYDYGYSSESMVTVDNDTGYELTIRYSGPSVKKIVIAKNSSEKISISSGEYKVVASAGGMNYSVTESYKGTHTVSYYITTSRY